MGSNKCNYDKGNENGKQPFSLQGNLSPGPTKVNPQIGVDFPLYSFEYFFNATYRLLYDSEL